MSYGHHLLHNQARGQHGATESHSAAGNTLMATGTMRRREKAPVLVHEAFSNRTITCPQPRFSLRPYPEQVLLIHRLESGRLHPEYIAVLLCTGGVETY